MLAAAFVAPAARGWFTPSRPTPAPLAPRMAAMAAPFEYNGLSSSIVDSYGGEHGHMMHHNGPYMMSGYSPYNNGRQMMGGYGHGGRQMMGGYMSSPHDRSRYMQYSGATQYSPYNSGAKYSADDRMAARMGMGGMGMGMGMGYGGYGGYGGNGGNGGYMNGRGRGGMG